MIATIISTNVNKSLYVTYISTTPSARLGTGGSTSPAALVSILYCQCTFRSFLSGFVDSVFVIFDEKSIYFCNINPCFCDGYFLSLKSFIFFSFNSSSLKRKKASVSLSKDNKSLYAISKDPSGNSIHI